MAKGGSRVTTYNGKQYREVKRKAKKMGKG